MSEKRRQPIFRTSEAIDPDGKRFLSISVWPTKKMDGSEVIQFQVRKREEDKWETIAQMAIYRTLDGEYSKLGGLGGQSASQAIPKKSGYMLCTLCKKNWHDPKYKQCYQCSQEGRTPPNEENPGEDTNAEDYGPPESKLQIGGDGE